MAIIYRGVCIQDDLRNDGKLRPKGSNIKVHIKYDGRFKYDSGVTYGESEINTVSAHQKQSGLYEGCLVSFTHDFEVAKRFATTEYTEKGYIYEVDTDLLEKNKVLEIKPLVIENPDEKEISLRAEDGGDLPSTIVVDKYIVDP
ncbi:hypothetical protein ACT3N8_05030 [Psychrobacter aquimaris]|jgi:hypothetical protein|uniref:hypothetical protein n=1 Tax=Psychrobacter aquimaris TaxID=292733 RepID=UPI003FD338A1